MTKSHLIFSPHSDPDVARNQELQRCRTANLQNPLLDVTMVEGWPTFDELFSKCRDGMVNIVCNADIIVPIEAVEQIQRHLKPNQFFALSKWDETPQGLTFSERPDTQDVWCILGKPKPMNLNFKPGKCGCDNRLAHCFKQAGYEVVNPAKSIKVIHVHASGVRRYSRVDAVPPPYLQVHPSVLV